MKKEEETVLINNKLGEGKSYSRINKELDNLKKSQIVFKENKKELIKLRSYISKLEKENNRLKQTNLVLGLKKENLEKKAKIEYNGDLKYLNRILLVLKAKGDKMSLKEITMACCSDTKSIKPCLKFLEKHNMIQSEYKSSASYYWLNKNVNGLQRAD